MKINWELHILMMGKRFDTSYSMKEEEEQLSECEQ